MNDHSTDVDATAGDDPIPIGAAAVRPAPFGGASALVDGPEFDVVDDASSTDGRTQRRERNRVAVIEALLDLIRSGNMEPNAASIAERAGVSHRSVFRYFADLDDLVRTAVDHEFRTVYPIGRIPQIGVGTLERRIDALVDARLRVYSATFQVHAMARTRAATIPAIDEGLRAVADVQRAQFRRQFASELERVDHDPGVEFMIDAAMVLMSFDGYSTHRRILGHGVERIRRVWATALMALLGPAAD